MLSFMLFMLATAQLLSGGHSTRLPLEVYELTPNTAGGNDLKHKNLEYATINAQPTATTSTSAQKHLSGAEALGSSPTNQLDRRRSRQMLDISLGHKPALMESGHREHETEANAKHHTTPKDVRILYQVGNSEDDLPVCAPNAVCSKIDLYETPWIERQCRCPAVNRAPEIVIHHHHKDTSGHSNHNSEKYHVLYEHSGLAHHQQSKHLLLDAGFPGADSKYENLHLKKLLHKLGAVYEDDLHLPSDYVMHEESNSALGDADDALAYGGDDLADNEFPAHVPLKRQHLYTNGPHMRHSGHMGRQERMSFIGGCPSGLGVEDGHTIADKTRHYKLCAPVHRLPVCRHFRDYTWTLTTSAEMNSTEQIVHCRCPKNSVTYLTKRQPLEDSRVGYKYLFACSPLTRLRCQRKQPCKLFTVRKRQEFIDEVNINALCQCPKGHHCPSHHTQSGVIAGESFLEDNIQTYSGYCMAND